MNFAERLKKAREEKRLSQSDLAQSSDVRYTQIVRYEDKVAISAADMLAKVAIPPGAYSGYLMNETTEAVANDTLCDKDLLNQFKTIEHMDDLDKGVVQVLLNVSFTTKQIQKLAHL
ncbi:MAG: helix-turn-helix transcriptional regulator [Bacteroidota bacterium]